MTDSHLTEGPEEVAVEGIAKMSLERRKMKRSRWSMSGRREAV
jgi:hypothetical protein